MPFSRHSLAGAFASCALFASPTLLLLAPVSAVAQATRSHASPDAEAFVESEANRVIGVFTDHRLAGNQKRQVFRRLIEQVADVPKITDFVLGKYRRSISPQQYGRFAQAFRQYAYDVYESRLNSYAGQRLQVVGSAERQPGDVIVHSRIVGPTNGAPPDVQWRLIRDGGGRWRAVDVNVSGIWLAITERQDFGSTLDNNGGNVDALIAQLRGQRSGDR